MALINLSIQHGRTLDEAKARMEMTVNELRAKFGPMVQRVEWATDRCGVKMFGPGYEVGLRVDAREIHAAIDVALLGGLLKSPIVSGIKGILQQTFQKRIQ